MGSHTISRTRCVLTSTVVLSTIYCQPLAGCMAVHAVTLRFSLQDSGQSRAGHRMDKIKMQVAAIELSWP